MRGFKRDATETIARQYFDERSFVSMPKVLPDCPNVQHEILYGKDKSWQRERVFTRSLGRCDACGIILHLAVIYPIAQWHHKAKKIADRCDCAEAAECRCRDCHLDAHAGRAPRWTKK